MIQYKNTANEDLTIELISMDGVTIYNNYIKTDDLEFNDVIDVSNLPRGFYFIRIYNQNFVNVNKVVIE